MPCGYCLFILRKDMRQCIIEIFPDGIHIMKTVFFYGINHILRTELLTPLHFLYLGIDVFKHRVPSAGTGIDEIVIQMIPLIMNGRYQGVNR